MPISEELKRSVFGDLQEPVLEAVGSGTAVRARRYQLELLEKAVHQNVRNLSRLCMVLPGLFVLLKRTLVLSKVHTRLHIGLNTTLALLSLPCVRFCGSQGAAGCLVVSIASKARQATAVAVPHLVSHRPPVGNTFYSRLTWCCFRAVSGVSSAA